MSRPLRASDQLLKRIGRHLKGRRRCVQKYAFDEKPEDIIVYSDSDWAGCKMTRKSTSGGVVVWGNHTLKSWSTVQNVVALSSGEAELYALLKGAVQLKHMIALAKDFGMELKGVVKTDSTAAIGISHRSGLGGRTRHIQVQHLWVQGAVANKEFKILKVASAENFADIFTNATTFELLDRHLSAMGFVFLPN